MKRWMLNQVQHDGEGTATIDSTTPAGVPLGRRDRSGLAGASYARFLVLLRRQEHRITSVAAGDSGLLPAQEHESTYPCRASSRQPMSRRQKPSGKAIASTA